MTAPTGYTVSLESVSPRAIAAVRARVPASGVSSSFRTYLDQVYAAGRGGSVQLDGQNVFVYRDVPGAPSQLDVEFGVGVTAPFAGAGNVEYSLVPDGRVATTTHWGDYAMLGAAHNALVEWCRSHDVRLAGLRWEVYGHWNAGSAPPRTDIFYLIDPPATSG